MQPNPPPHSGSSEPRIPFSLSSGLVLPFPIYLWTLTGDPTRTSARRLTTKISWTCPNTVSIYATYWKSLSEERARVTSTNPLEWPSRIWKGESISLSPVFQKISSIFRHIREIKLALGRTSTPHAEYNKKKVEELKRAIQEVFSVLNLQSSSLDENPGVIERATVAPDTSDDATTSAAKSGTSSAPPSPIFRTVLTVP